jgi:hypothetical protein
VDQLEEEGLDGANDVGGFPRRYVMPTFDIWSLGCTAVELVALLQNKTLTEHKTC